MKKVPGTTGSPSAHNKALCGSSQPSLLKNVRQCSQGKKPDGEDSTRLNQKQFSNFDLKYFICPRQCSLCGGH